MHWLALICGLQLVLIAGLLVDRRSERQEVARERGDLLQHAHEREQALMQRIQAPAAEVVRYHYGEEIDAPPAVRGDDEPGADEDWMSARLTKEDLARAAAEEELTRA